MTTKVEKFSIPEIPELSKESKYLYDVFNEEENELACVLIATSYLENALASVLSCHFIEENDIVGRLLNPLSDGALSTFAARSDVAYCLGLITEGFHKNLKVIGRIRNKFAHGYSPLNLDHPEIAKMVDSLTFPTVFRTVLADDGSVSNTKWPPPFEQWSNRVKFTVIVISMFNRLLLTGLGMKHREKETKGWE